MMKSRKLRVAIIGSGNIGTDLMIKVLRHAQHLEMGAMVGIDRASDGLARASRLGVPTTCEGVEGLMRMSEFGEIELGRRRMVGGQEDMIVDVALDLAGEHA